MSFLNKSYLVTEWECEILEIVLTPDLLYLKSNLMFTLSVTWLTSLLKPTPLVQTSQSELIYQALLYTNCEDMVPLRQNSG